MVCCLCYNCCCCCWCCCGTCLYHQMCVIETLLIFFLPFFYIPLQENSLQGLLSDKFGGQEADDLLHPRRLTWLPPPQVELQDSHGDQIFQPEIIIWILVTMGMRFIQWSLHFFQMCVLYKRAMTSCTMSDLLTNRHSAQNSICGFVYTRSVYQWHWSHKFKTLLWFQPQRKLKYFKSIKNVKREIRNSSSMISPLIIWNYLIHVLPFS